jgi:hypothetical protein
MASKEITSSDNNAFFSKGIPTAPDISSFQRHGTTRPATRSQSTVDNEIGSHISISFTNLPSEDQKAYQFVYNIYLEKGKRYEAQLTSIDKLKEWIRKTVILNYQQTCCRPTESITQWYEKLKEHVTVSEYEAETEARDKYRRSIKPVSKVKDILNWITTWEQAMATAQQKILSVATIPVSGLMIFDCCKTCDAELGAVTVVHDNEDFRGEEQNSYLSDTRKRFS